jgi:AcrR family transcriptional regulator
VDVTTSTSRKRTRDPQAKKDAIMVAARKRFSRDNYDAVGLRQIASDIGVDVALVAHYFTSKDALFMQVLREALSARYILDFDKQLVGEDLVETLLRDYSDPSGEHYLRLVVNAAAAPAFSEELKQVMDEQVLTPMPECYAGRHAAVRARLLTTLTSGICLSFLATHFEEGLDEGERALIRRILGTLIQKVVDGDLELMLDEPTTPTG